MMTSLPVADAAARGRWIPYAFVAFFMIVVAVNAIMIGIAFSTWTGLTTERSYQRGLDYNRALEAAAAQDTLGWKVGLAFTQVEGRHALLEVTLADRHGDLMETAGVQAELVRPTQAGHDLTVTLPHYYGGRYRAEVELPLAGQWDVRIKATDGADVFRLHERVFVRP